MPDLLGLNSKAVRAALEVVAENQRQIAKAVEVAASSPTRRVLDEAERQRTQMARLVEEAGRGAIRPSEEAAVDCLAAQIEYARRAVTPLDVNQLTRELASTVRSNASIGAKQLATEIVREQAQLSAARAKHRLVPDHGLAGRLLEEARRTLGEAQAGAEDLGTPRPGRHPAEDAGQSPQGEDASSVGKETPDAGDQPGIGDLIDAIREESERTRETIREEGERTRETIESSGESKGRISLLLSLATLLVSLAALFLQAKEPPEVPVGPRPPFARIQGPMPPSSAGPSAGALQFGPPVTIRPDRGRDHHATP